jgi:cytochrome c-type biogenesis protein CcmH/NrfF
MVLAHPGHWLANLLYTAPVVLVIGTIGFQALRERRRERRERKAK